MWVCSIIRIIWPCLSSVGHGVKLLVIEYIDITGGPGKYVRSTDDRVLSVWNSDSAKSKWISENEVAMSDNCHYIKECKHAIMLHH